MILVIEWGRQNRIAQLLSPVVTNLENTTVKSETEPSWFCSDDQTQFFKDSLFSSAVKICGMVCWRVTPCILICGYQQCGRTCNPTFFFLTERFEGTFSLEHLSIYFLDFNPLALELDI